ncbi:hypothetical protein [Comamonas thiooxydans]|uniref:hypothetical protein n=1 Tax=Comamonas thiooxydans TaxID=363952 RepID=UPI0011846FB1|nr:hypothetical protein [Comamonas thiooxydans]
MSNEITAEVIARAVERMREAERVKKNFLQSPTFERLLAPFIDREGPLEVESENFSYNSAKVKKLMGWESESDEDIRMFINVMSDHHGPFVDQATVEDLHTGSFPLFVFENSGLWVSVMIGQGSSVSLYNEEAYNAWRLKIQPLLDKQKK